MGRLQKSAGVGLVGLGLMSAASCSAIWSPSFPPIPVARVDSGDRIAQFDLRAYSSGTLQLPASNRLVLILTTGGDTRYVPSEVVIWPRAVQEAGSAPPENESFWVSNANPGPKQAQADYRQIRARKSAEGTNALFYLDETSTASLEALPDLVETLDRQMFPALVQALGASPPTLNGDPRVFVVFTPALGNRASGLMMPNDLRPVPGKESWSNKKAVVFMRDSVLGDRNWGAVAHEFVHIIWGGKYVEKGLEEYLAFEEGLAQLGEDLAGFGPDKQPQRFYAPISILFENFGTSNAPQSLIHEGYEMSYLFFRYLQDRFPAFLRLWRESDEVGQDAIDSVLKRQGTNLREAYRDWAAANYLHGRGVTQEPRFRYSSFNPRVGKVDGAKLSGESVVVDGVQPSTVADDSVRFATSMPLSIRYFQFEGGSNAPWAVRLQSDAREINGTAVRLD